MIKILVTGSNGQLGLSIQKLREQNHNFKFVFKSSKQLDITNLNKVKICFENQIFDYCINCAAYTAVDKAETEKNKAFEVNARGVSNLATVCKDSNTILIHISTDFVFDGNKKSPYDETDKANPINIYGESKLKGEENIINTLTQYFIIRTSWVYSEYGNNFVKTMLKLGSTKDEISVVGNQFGSPTYALDLAEFIFDIINSRSKRFGLYHFSNEGNISWFEFANYIFQLFQLNVKVNKIDSNKFKSLAKRPSFSVLSLNRLKSELNFKTTSWKESLQNFKRNYDESSL